MRVVHIITGLGDGGAEHTLFKICKYDNINKHIVISLKGPGKYFSLLNKLGVKVYCLNIKFFSINRFFFLIKLLSDLKPNVVQTWLVHADFLGGITARHNMGITKNKDYCAVDEVITFSNVPENCAIVIDKEHKYTMDNSGSLTTTALQAGSYYITFTHSESRKYFWQGFTFYVTGLTV